MNRGHLRFLNTLGGRVAAAATVMILLMLVGGVLIAIQIIRARDAMTEIQASTRHLRIALTATQQTAELVATAREGVTDRTDIDQFVSNIAPSLLMVERQRMLLQQEANALPIGSDLRTRMSIAATVLGNVTDVTGRIIGAVEGGNWDLADYLLGELAVNYRLTEQESQSLLLMTRLHHERAEAEIHLSGQRIMLIIPLITTLVLLSATGSMVVSLRGIFTGLGLLSRSARQLAAGHFEERIPVQGLEEFRLLARTFNDMGSELQKLYASLERLVAQRTAELARRTTQLEAAAHVARQAAEIRDLDTLLNETVRLIPDRFGFYHAGIFLVDDAGEYAVLRAASSEGGQRMLARGHKLAVGKVGIVGYVAGTGQPRIALDVGADAVFFDNPDLPLTRSEMALPLKVGEQVIGVLDVQSVEPGAFAREDVSVLQTMADQVALAIENARLLEESQRRLGELNRLYGEWARQAWQERAARRPMAYRYTGVSVDPLPAPPLRVAGETDGRQMQIPIRLRGQTIGTVILQRTREQAPWSPEEQRMAEEIGEQIALALEGARLLEEAQRHAERDRLIAEITARVRASMDPETVLRTALRELGIALDADRVMVQIGSLSVREG